MKATNPLEEMVSKLTEELGLTIDKLPSAAKPYGHETLSEDQQVERYMKVRESSEAFAALIERHGVKAAVEYARTMEHKLGRRNANTNGT